MVALKEIARRKPIVLLLCVTAFAPIVFFGDELSETPDVVEIGALVAEFSSAGVGSENGKLTDSGEEIIGLVYVEDSSESEKVLGHKSNGLDTRNQETKRLPLSASRVLSTFGEGTFLDGGSLIGHGTIQDTAGNGSNAMPKIKLGRARRKFDGAIKHKNIVIKQTGRVAAPNAKVRQLKDQLIRSRVYLSLSSTRANPQFIRELRLRVRDVQRALGEATKDSELSKNVDGKLKAMEQTLFVGRQIEGDCSDIVGKLRAMLHSSEEVLLLYRKQTSFLSRLTSKNLPKGLHCLPVRLSNDFFSLEPKKQEFLNQEKLENPSLFHYALFSDNILAAAVVVNSTATNAKEPTRQVFHIVTDRQNFAAMRMWFLANPHGEATVHVQNYEDFTWFNSSYSPVLKQLEYISSIDYFRAELGNSDAGSKHRNPKYLSVLNHLRFYIPEIFPKLNKIVFLDDDVVIQKDLTALWGVDMVGKVNGAVETCSEAFHTLDRYLNFSNDLIAKNFDPRACSWAFGMNVFDLDEWRKQKITEVYHKWQNLNQDGRLWNLGTLPPGLISFWNRTVSLDPSWHVLDLGYNPYVDTKKIEHAAVIHYNGNMKPWLDTGMPEFRGYWSKYLEFNQTYLRDCNINP